MHHALVLSILSSTFLVLTTLSGTTGDPGPQSANNLQEDAYLFRPRAQPQPFMIPRGFEEDQRSWSDLENGFEKKSWGDLRNGWGKRDEDIQNYLGKRAWSELRAGSWGKRDWSQFRGGWGKRNIADQLAEMRDEIRRIEEEDKMNDILPGEQSKEKRTWSQLRGQWGKRDDSTFKGIGEKRDPAWNNLKGLWGKRSLDNWTRLKGPWGRR